MTLFGGRKAKRDRKGHIVNPSKGFTVCRSCLADDWKNYYVKVTE